MNAGDIQKLKAQLNETRRWFYLNAKEIFGVDITGIPLPRVEPTVSGGFHDQHRPEDNYDYLEPTEFDRAQAEESIRKADEDAPFPRIYLAMGKFLHTAVQYLEMRQDVADGEHVPSFQAQARNLEHALREVELAAQFPPFPEAKAFVADIAQRARIAHVVVTSDRVISSEAAELQLEQRVARDR